MRIVISTISRCISLCSALIVWLLLLVIKTYRHLVSPLLGQNCRFHPSCSCYAHEALVKHGFFKGSWLAFMRIVKCHPLHPGGIDEVPKPNTKQHSIYKLK